MRNRIAAIIIDPDKDQHDYSNIRVNDDYYYGFPYGEHEFDIKILTSHKNILSEINEFRGLDCIITVGNYNEFTPLNDLSFEFRKKWVHFNTFNATDITKVIVNVFLNNINRERPVEAKLFSIFTCTFNTSKLQLNRLYNSLKSQTYHNWNWYILDDSTDSDVSNAIANYNDPRIILFKNISNHGNIGFNKHIIASVCDGDYLVEVDHDDELTPDCLELLLKAFTLYSDSDFVYSHTLELIGGQSVSYGDYFAYGLGEYATKNVLGTNYMIPLTPDINAVSVRGIHALPNHVRCWKKEFYHKIGGHNIELSVLDDMDILIRTFLYGEMTKIDKVLYIQHEGDANPKGREFGSTAQSKRFREIQRTNVYLRRKYDAEIHNRILSLGYEDPVWNDTAGRCVNIYEYDKSKLQSFNQTLTETQF